MNRGNRGGGRPPFGFNPNRGRGGPPMMGRGGPRGFGPRGPGGPGGGPPRWGMQFAQRGMNKPGGMNAVPPPGHQQWNAMGWNNGSGNNFQSNLHHYFNLHVYLSFLCASVCHSSVFHHVSCFKVPTAWCYS